MDSKGKISEIVYKSTRDYNPQFCTYLAIHQLLRLLELIIEADETTEYLRITPFYRNSICNFQIEYDELMFFIECRDNISSQEKKNFIEECRGESIDRKEAEVLFCLCNSSDKKTFHKAILKYRDYLKVIARKIYKDVKSGRYIDDEEMLAGCICFEVHCE